MRPEPTASTPEAQNAPERGTMKAKRDRTNLRLGPPCRKFGKPTPPRSNWPRMRVFMDELRNHPADLVDRLGPGRMHCTEHPHLAHPEPPGRDADCVEGLKPARTSTAGAKPRAMTLLGEAGGCDHA